MVCTQGLKVTATGRGTGPAPTKVTGRVMRSKKAERYSVFMNQPGAVMPKMFRLFSTPPPTKTPLLRLNELVWPPTGKPLNVFNSVVPDQCEPVQPPFT